MPTVPLYGHAALRERLLHARAASAIPSTLLLHGPAGIGKQRLALWIGQLLLCESTNDAHALPCLKCEQCRYSAAFTHPDLHWCFPRPRLKDSDPSPEDVRLDYAAAIAQRVQENLLYQPASGAEGIYVATVRAIVHDAAMAPSLARRKVFVVGNADRMVSQEGSDQAANAFLKLLEEPPANTTIILTSSEPGALLPTVRSRVISLRMTRLAERDMRAFLDDALVAARAGDTLRKLESDRGALQAFVRAGAPGALLAAEATQRAFDIARTFLAASTSTQRSQAIKAALAMGATGARAGFSDILDALAELVHDRTRTAVLNGDEAAAPRSAAAVLEIESARQLAYGNISPQLLGIRLAASLSRISS